MTLHKIQIKILVMHQLYYLTRGKLTATYGRLIALYDQVLVKA